MSKREDISHLDTLSVEQAAQLLHLGRDATRALIEAGDIPAMSCNQKHTVLLRRDVLEYIATNAREQSEQRKAAQRSCSPRTRRRPRKALPDLDLYDRHA